MDQIKQRSLPRNPEIAVTEYRSWLLQSIATHGLQQASLDSGNPARVRNLYDRIDFSLRTRGTLSQLTAFLRQFYSTNYVHTIGASSLKSTSDGTLDISLTVETLVVPVVADDAHLPQHLPAPGELASEDTYRVISQRNLFRQGASPTAKIKVSAITCDAQRQRQVWLSFLTTSETRILAAGDQFSLDGTHLKIQAIQAEYADPIDNQTHYVVKRSQKRGKEFAISLIITTSPAAEKKWK